MIHEFINIKSHVTLKAMIIQSLRIIINKKILTRGPNEVPETFLYIRTRYLARYQR